MQRVVVMVQIPVVVEYDDSNTIEEIKFMIEENGCPGTGKVGNALEELVERNRESRFCEMCNVRAENKVISIKTVHDDNGPKNNT